MSSTKRRKPNESQGTIFVYHHYPYKYTLLIYELGVQEACGYSLEATNVQELGRMMTMSLSRSWYGDGHLLYEHPSGSLSLG